ncbi:epimerase [Spirosoma sp. KUDC1026]|uniref:epimerase n=1 Tax=Spirosoma sp. KUDC1026 TaxID=2745947 RepID=UPI00159BD7D3|nr:epimerase [Spirosoma sp. KUDC1026]QKZ13302.1 epimerase [Spirosoma sp. KUDC1026]
MAIRAIITGATGMVGEGVLLEALQHPDVEQVLVINRKPGGLSHPKLKEVIHDNFLDLSPISDQLANYNACFFCLGVSSLGMSETDYRRITYDLTLHVAETLVKQNPDMTFCYVSGAGTDSTEKGSMAWARVKGKTENTLLRLPFKAAYMFRPGFIIPVDGQKNVKTYYRFLLPILPLLKGVFSSYISSMHDLGLAMINTVRLGYEKPILEVKDINQLAKRS